MRRRVSPRAGRPRPPLQWSVRSSVQIQQEIHQLARLRRADLGEDGQRPLPVRPRRLASLVDIHGVADEAKRPGLAEPVASLLADRQRPPRVVERDPVVTGQLRLVSAFASPVCWPAFRKSLNAS